MSKKLKIAIIGSRGYPYVYSGYETLVKELSDGLINKGHSVRVYCHNSLFTQKPRYVNGVELIYTPSIETKFLSQFVNSFFSFVHVCFSKVDIVFVVNSSNGPFGILTKLFSIKTCINVDGLEWLRPKWKGIGSIYYRISSKLSTKLYDQVVTDSLEMSKIYKKLYNTDSEIIAYGSTMVDEESNQFLSKFNLKKNDYYLIVGRLIPDNNSKLLIDGFVNSGSNKKIVIVGDVPYKDNYAESVKNMSSNNIVFTGYICDKIELTTLYKNCYAYVHGHEFGGTNPTMINALDLNCQVLALDTAFNREMLEYKTSIIFKKDLQSVANSFSDFEKTYSLLNKKNINYKLPIKYSWKHVVNSYLDLFFKLTNYQSK